MAINWFEPRTLLGVWEQTGKRARTFLQDVFFARRYNSPTEHIDMDEVVSNRIMAAFSAVDGAGKTVNRNGFKVKTYVPPALKPRMNQKALDLLQRLPGENVYDGMKPDERETALVQRDLLQMNQMNTRRREWMCAQTMFGGQVVMVGDDYSQTLDFGLTMKTTLTGNDLWSADTATPLDNLETWVLAVAAETGVVPDKCIMATDVARAFMAHPDIVAQSEKFSNQLVKINPTPLEAYPGAISLGSVRTPTGYLIEVMVYTEWYEEVAANGTVTRHPMVPAGQLVLANPNDSFILAFGAYTDVSLTPSVTFQVEEYPRQWVDTNIPMRFMELVSRPLTAPTLTNAWYHATVL